MATATFEGLRKDFQQIVSTCSKTKDINLLSLLVERTQVDGVDCKAPLDQAFRDTLLDLLDRQVAVCHLFELLDFCLLVCRKELCSATLPVVLLSDTFEVLTLDVCSEMFTYVERNVDTWKEPLFFTCCKNNLLRLCNDLLRRLSRSTATVFCGRILLFLAKFFPFSERSGLNIVSEFNLENVTEFGTDATNMAETSDEESSQNASQDKTTLQPSEQQKSHSVDFTFYCKFWSLQDYFRNPLQLYNRVQWKQFCSYCTSVLDTFQGLKLDKEQESGRINEHLYFSKYLTNHKLLDLQLYDSNFRRTVLLQCLVLFQYLGYTVKSRSESLELKPDQKDWLQSTTDKVYTLLRETPPDGERFATIVANILGREEYWNTWKNDGCPELKRPAPPTAPAEQSDSIDHQQQSLEPSSSKRKRSSSGSHKPPLLQHQPQQPQYVGDLIRSAASQGKYYMGNDELTKLWNHCPNNLDACRGRERNFLPTMDEYFSEVLQQAAPPADNTTAAGGPTSNLLKDSNFGWRALRLLAKRSPHFFTYSNTIVNPMAAYLEMMVKKFANDCVRESATADRTVPEVGLTTTNAKTKMSASNNPSVTVRQTATSNGIPGNSKTPSKDVDAKDSIASSQDSAGNSQPIVCNFTPIESADGDDDDEDMVQQHADDEMVEEDMIADDDNEGGSGRKKGGGGGVGSGGTITSNNDNDASTGNMVSMPQLAVFAEAVVGNWRQLATKLGYKPDEIEFFQQEHTSELESAKRMLQMWFDDDEDATLDNFAYILEGLRMDEASAVVKRELNSLEEPPT